MYFLGAEHLALAFAPMWDRIGAKYGNNHQVAAAFPNDSDGNAFRAVFPQVLGRWATSSTCRRPTPTG